MAKAGKKAAKPGKKKTQGTTTPADTKKAGYRPARDERGRWKKGWSGNPKGGPRHGESIVAIIHEIGQKHAELRVDGKKERRIYIELLVLKAFQMAIQKGDVAAMKFLAGYRDGLPVQRLEHTGREGEPIEIVFPEEFDGV